MTAALLPDTQHLLFEAKLLPRYQDLKQLLAEKQRAKTED